MVIFYSYFDITRGYKYCWNSQKLALEPLEPLEPEAFPVVIVGRRDDRGDLAASPGPDRHGNIGG